MKSFGFRGVREGGKEVLPVSLELPSKNKKQTGSPSKENLALLCVHLYLIEKKNPMGTWTVWYRIDSAAGGTEEAGGGSGRVSCKVFFISPLCFFILQVRAERTQITPLFFYTLFHRTTLPTPCDITNSTKRASKAKTVQSLLWSHSWRTGFPVALSLYTSCSSAATLQWNERKLWCYRLINLAPWTT